MDFGRSWIVGRARGLKLEVSKMVTQGELQDVVDYVCKDMEKPSVPILLSNRMKRHTGNCGYTYFNAWGPRKITIAKWLVCYGDEAFYSCAIHEAIHVCLPIEEMHSERFLELEQKYLKQFGMIKTDLKKSYFKHLKLLCGDVIY